MKPKISTAARSTSAARAAPATPAPAAAVSRRDIRVAQRIGQAYGYAPAVQKSSR